MIVVKDDPPYRYLRFRHSKQNSFMWFNIVTWPGTLVIEGDMGTYVFSRTVDMFTFFRPPDDNGRVNLGYWAEKCRSGDRPCGVTRYSPELARKEIMEQAEQAREEMTGWTKGMSEGLAEELEDEVLIHVDNGEARLRDAIEDFHYEGFRFIDFWEVDLTEYTPQYEWCCHAIVYAISTYDASKAGG